MKQILLFIAFFATGFMFSQEVTHVDFDVNNPDIVFNSWNTSSTFIKTANPTGASDAGNVSANVGQFIAGSDNGIGIGVINPKSVFASPFDLTALSYFKMKVFTTEEMDVTFHIENDPDWGNFLEVTQTVTQLNQWVELTFDFTGESNIFMDNIVIKVSGPSWIAGDFMFFDDIIQVEIASCYLY